MKKVFLFVAALCATVALNAATITLEPGENKIGDAMATLADGDVIELQTGTYYEWNTLEFSTKVTLKAAEGATPIVQPNVIKIKNDFEANGITFINLSKDNYLLRTGANVTGTIAIKNCNLQLNAEVSNPVPYIYLSSNTVGTLVIDNCTFAPNAKTEGSIVYGLTPVTNFTMTNSTAVACGGTDLAVYMTGLTTATVDHCTFYNCGARVLYLKGDTMASCAVSNCIVANAALVEQYCVATYAGTVDNVLYYNTKAPRSSDATVNGCINEDPMFVDAANGNFKLAVGSPAIGAGKDGKNIGDLRWGNEKAAPTGYAVVYTSNVEFTAEGGTKATLSQVVVAEGDTVKAIKCGTGSVDGSCVITIPAATKTLHFHAVAWTGKPLTMDVNGTIYDLTADSGISGNGSTYTLAGNPYDYYFSFDPKGATAITFTAKSDHRFVLFGVNAELEEGTLAAPSFTPAESEFAGSVEVTLTADEGADIYYTLDGTTPSDASTKYESAFKLTATTTVKAIAIKDGKSSEVAEKTYTLIPTFASLEDLVSQLPATDTKVKVQVTLTDVVIDSFYVSKGYTNGVYVTVNGAALELYKYDVPETWEVGGTISGTIVAEWSLYKGVPELQNFDSWDAFTYTAPTPQLEEITENFFVNLEAAEGLNEATTAAVNEGVLTVIAAAEPWAAGGVKIPFDGYVKATNLAGIKASAKVPTGGVEVCAYVIDQDGKRWYQESMNSTTYADWASFSHRKVPFVTLWDGGTAEDWANAQLVAFGFYGASGSGLENFEINLKEIEILVGEQTALNNVKASTKAVKAVRNGMIVIERNGVRYNVLGAQF